MIAISRLTIATSAEERLGSTFVKGSIPSGSVKSRSTSPPASSVQGRFLRVVVVALCVGVSGAVVGVGSSVWSSTLETSIVEDASSD